MLIFTPDGQIKGKKLNEKDTLKCLQKEVGGLIELVYCKNLQDHGIDVYVNEEGKLDGLPLSGFLTVNGNIVDTLQGNIVFVSSDEDGNTVDLSEEQETYLYLNLTVGKMPNDKCVLILAVD